MFPNRKAKYYRDAKHSQTYCNHTPTLRGPVYQSGLTIHLELGFFFFKAILS